MVISALALIIFTQSTGIGIPFTAIPWQSWTAMGYLVIFGSLISFIAYIYALRNLPTEQVSVYAYINPIVAVLLGAAIFSEKLTTYIAVGGFGYATGCLSCQQSFQGAASKGTAGGRRSVVF